MKRFLFSLLVLACLQPLQAQDAQEGSDQHRLTLRRAVDLALENNLDIQVEKYNPQISDTDVIFEKSSFEPLFSANLDTNDTQQPTGSILVGEDSLSASSHNWNFTFQQLLKTGTSYDVTFNNTRIDTTQAFTSINPRYDSSLFFSVNQPLLRNFGLGITTTPLKIAQMNRITSDERLKQRMMNIALQVEQAYWDLFFGIRELDVQKQSLAAAQDLYENNKKQVEVGTMAPLEIVVAEAEVASRVQGLIRTETFIKNTADRLKILIYGDKEPEKWDLELLPTDEPVVKKVDIDAEDAIRQALAANPDLKALESDLNSKKLSSKLANDGLKPQLDLRASLGYQGLGGETLLFDDSFPPNPIGSEPGGYGGALDTMLDNPTWSVGFVVGIPIGNKSAEATYIRADLAEKQSAAALESAKQQLMLNIRTALHNLESDLKRLDAARASRVLQEKKLDAERKKLNVGLSTNHVVLDFQEDLALAQSTELLALVDYNKDMAQLQRYMGDILMK